MINAALKGKFPESLSGLVITIFPEVWYIVVEKIKLNGGFKMEVAYTLYRVSTKKQVDKTKDDIPMQKEACREFAERMGWHIGKEFLEKGVSGFKVSAQNRDAIQDLKTAALKGEFQILLVFMFDRIGRIDDETPFVVECES